MTHEVFIHQVRRLVVPRLADPEILRKLQEAKLTYGWGRRGERGACFFEAWERDGRMEFIEVCARGEESPTQLAGTTIHELAQPRYEY